MVHVIRTPEEEEEEEEISRALAASLAEHTQSNPGEPAHVCAQAAAGLLLNAFLVFPCTCVLKIVQISSPYTISKVLMLFLIIGWQLDPDQEFEKLLAQAKEASISTALEEKARRKHGGSSSPSLHCSHPLAACGGLDDAQDIMRGRALARSCSPCLPQAASDSRFAPHSRRTDLAAAAATLLAMSGHAGGWQSPPADFAAPSHPRSRPYSAPAPAPSGKCDNSSEDGSVSGKQQRRGGGSDSNETPVKRHKLGVQVMHDGGGTPDTPEEEVQSLASTVTYLHTGASSGGQAAAGTGTGQGQDSPVQESAPPGPGGWVDQEGSDSQGLPDLVDVDVAADQLGGPELPPEEHAWCGGDGVDTWNEFSPAAAPASAPGSPWYQGAAQVSSSASLRKYCVNQRVWWRDDLMVLEGVVNSVDYRTQPLLYTVELHHGPNRYIESTADVLWPRVDFGERVWCRPYFGLGWDLGVVEATDMYLHEPQIQVTGGGPWLRTCFSSPDSLTNVCHSQRYSLNDCHDYMY